MEAGHRLPCTMCGSVQGPGSQICYDPDAGGLVCSRCGQEEEPDGSQPGPDEQPSGIVTQVLDDASPEPPAAEAT